MANDKPLKASDIAYRQCLKCLVRSIRDTIEIIDKRTLAKPELIDAGFIQEMAEFDIAADSVLDYLDRVKPRVG